MSNSDEPQFPYRSHYEQNHRFQAEALLKAAHAHLDDIDPGQRAQVFALLAIGHATLDVALNTLHTVSNTKAVSDYRWP